VEARIPGVKVNLNVGRSTSFEVTTGEEKTLVYSKLASGNFPDYGKVAQQIADMK